MHLTKRKCCARKYVIGRGLMEWIAKAADFIVQNKDTITNTANVLGSIAKASGSTAMAVKQIKDAAAKKRPPIVKDMSQRGADILMNLSRSHVEGGGFKMISY